MATSTSNALALFLAVNLLLFSYTSAKPCAPKPSTLKPYKPRTGGSTGGSGSSGGGGISVGVGGGNGGGIIGGRNGGGIVGGGTGGGIVGGGNGGGVVGGGNGGGIINVGGGGVGVGSGNGGGVRTRTGTGIFRGGKCPIDTLKLGVCANVLNGLVNVVVGKPPKTPCCTLVQGLADLEATICLCTALKANILGINLNIPVSLSLLVNYCGKKVPKGYVCP